jgi:hypothetical protein
MAWTASAMFREWPKAVMGQGQTAAVLPAGPYLGLGADSVKVSLHNNSITPDKDAAITSTGYNTGVWTTTNEVTDTDGSSDWSAGGLALSGKTLTTPSSGVFMFDATDLTHSNTVTLANVYGCLVYDNAITAGTGGCAAQGVSFHYFGGGQSVTAGTFTIVWHANGLFRITT